MRASDVASAVCQYAVAQLAASGCAVTLMAGPPSVEVLAVAGRNADELAELQFTLGEGPCLDAFLSCAPTFAVDLAYQGGRWPLFRRAPPNSACSRSSPCRCDWEQPPWASSISRERSRE